MKSKYLNTIYVMALVLLVNACTSVDPHTGQQRTSRATYGSGIGAGTGAVIGAIAAGDDSEFEGALIGAGIGALLGGGIGYHMDKQAEALHNELQMSGVQVNRFGNKLVLNFPRKVYFEQQSSVLKPEFEYILNSLAQVLNRNDFSSSNIIIEGYADKNEAEANALSESRAKQVYIYLLKQSTGKHRIEYVGYGSGKPASYTNPQENRRVEVTISSVQS